ncbi:FAD-dependent oxidoreductase [Bacillales bacterium AN1005]
MKRSIIIIGAGFGGLSCAIRLASQGVQVTVLERQQQPGGKLQQIEKDGYHFDRGQVRLRCHLHFARSLSMQVLRWRIMCDCMS